MNFTRQFPVDASRKLRRNSFSNFSHELFCTPCNEHVIMQRSTHGSKQKVLMKDWKRPCDQRDAQPRQSIPSVRLHTTHRQVTQFAKAYIPPPPKQNTLTRNIKCMRLTYYKVEISAN